MYKTKKHFVVLAQFITAFSFAMVALALPMSNFFTYTIALLIIIAFSGATNDIATDGIYLNELTPKLQLNMLAGKGQHTICKDFNDEWICISGGQLEESIVWLNAWVTVMLIFAESWQFWIISSKNAAKRRKSSGRARSFQRSN